MNDLLFDESMEVPEERDLCLPSERQRVESPKTKSSKLTLDKGYIKKKDIEDFNKSCKSSQDISSPLFKDNPEFFFLMKKIHVAFAKHIKREREKDRKSEEAKTRDRINSASTEFRLLPLLRKVS